MNFIENGITFPHITSSIWNMRRQWRSQYNGVCKKFKISVWKLNTNYRANRTNTLYTTTNCLQTGKYFKTIKYFLMREKTFVALKQKIFFLIDWKQCLLSAESDKSMFTQSPDKHCILLTKHRNISLSLLFNFNPININQEE